MATLSVAAVWNVFDAFSRKFQGLRFDLRGKNLDIHSSVTVTDVDDLSSKKEIEPMKAVSQVMELDLLERRIRRLVAKLKKQNVNLEVFDHKDIEYGSVLGKGGEGIVQRCTVLYNKLPVEAAVKTVLNSSDDALNITLDEIELLCLSKDPIITTTQNVYGVAAVPERPESNFGHLVIITEAGIENALQLYQEEGRSIPLYVTYDLWSRLAAAVHCIHGKRIIHQDLKPENILITAILRDCNGDIEKIDFKIIDLGMGRRLTSDKITSDDILGTNGYHAPEVLFDDSYDCRADIFMLGVTFCVMLLPALQLRKASLQGLLKKIHEAKQQKIFGRNLFVSVIEPAMSSGIGSSVSIPIRNMICTMLEGLDRRHVTLLDVVSLCHIESVNVRTQADANVRAQHYSTCNACPLDSGIDSNGEGMASQRTLHKIGMLESHVHRQTSPRRRHSQPVKSEKKKTPVQPSRQSVTRRTSSISTTSSEASQHVTPKRRLQRRSIDVVPTVVCRKPSLRSSVKRLFSRVESIKEQYSSPAKRRVLRSSSSVS